ncbi:TonB family protein [Rudaea cellulosilytica]|uniref:TonB family protein n=1 Tax=Rudaea cellulosilytica TaxID=540746 RepID=UPI0003692C22|nr:TonB family protein [Rudaea cellulosilytica]
MTHDLLIALGRGALAAGLALAVVLAMRVPARRWLGAAFAYRLWLLVPVAALATLLPAPARPLIPALQVASSMPSSSQTIELQAAVAQAVSFDWQPWLLALWIAGALALVVVFARQQRRYLKNLGVLSADNHGALRAQATDGCPALVGALRPRIVVPSDFESRYTPRERELVLAHERTHLVRGDAQINALAALLRCLNWFNPLFHLAASRFRFDQEIACDAAVMSRFPEARRCYADAMLKAQLVGRSRQELRLPAGCHWPQSHPLKERIAMLKFPAMTGVRRALASAAIVALVSSAGYASWAAQPGSAPTTQAPMAKMSNQTSASAMVQTDFALTIDGVRIFATKADQRNADLTGGGWTTTFDGDAIVNTRDGSFAVLNRFGETFRISARRDNETYDLDGVAKDLGDGTIEFDGTIWHNGAVISKPSLVAVDGKQAAVRVGTGGSAATNPPSTSASPAEPGVVVGNDGWAQGLGLALTMRKIADTPPTEDLSYRRMYPPKYPAEAVRNRVTGKVMLKVSVDERGMPTSAEVESVKPEESARVLADAAIATAMKWRFNPGIKDGVPAGGSVMVPVDFMLRDDDGNPMPPPDPVSEVNVSYRKMRPPVYPREAIAAKVSGALYMRAHIDADGNVADAYVDQAVPVSALVLKEPALAALKAWQFNPQTRNGAPVESDVLVPMQFRLEGEPAAPANSVAPTYPDSVKRLEAIVVTGSAS